MQKNIAAFLCAWHRPYHIFTSKWARAVRMSGVGGTIAPRARTGKVAPALFKVEVNESMLRLRYERREFSEMYTISNRLGLDCVSSPALVVWFTQPT